MFLMGENIVVYEALREHIIHKEDQIDNETIYMYVTYFALLAVGTIWNSWISLAPFISLIAFQSMINGDQWSVTKASLYIKIFFETERNDIHWELLHQDPFYLSVHFGTIKKTVGWHVCKYGSTFLAILSFLAILVPILHASNYQIDSISPASIIRITLALALCIVTVHVNRQYFSLCDSEGPSKNLAKVINDFYKNYKDTFSEK